MNQSLQERIARAVSEEISIEPYDANWRHMFDEEKSYLEKILPESIILRIEHFGSTAVEGLPSKPIIDMLIEVSSLEETRDKIVPILESKGYDYFWRPEFDGPPYYAWFIKRGEDGKRTHHIHMVESDSKLWDRLYFRDYLRMFPDVAAKYAIIKTDLSKKYPNDRIEYTKGKTDFVVAVTQKAIEFFKSAKK